MSPPVAVLKQCPNRATVRLHGLNHQIRCFAALGANPPHKSPVLRIMPLGGSVTYGQGSSDGNGYRGILLEKLTKEGYRAEMVGSRSTGLMRSNHHEGWRGYRLDQIHQKARLSVPKIRPNLFLVNAGSNDCLQNMAIDNFYVRMGDMLDYLWSTCSGSTILLSTLLVNADASVQSRLRIVNEQIKRIAATKADKGSKIILVDMQDLDGPQLADLGSDGTHPHDNGYSKMANLWHRGICLAAQRGHLSLE